MILKDYLHEEEERLDKLIEVIEKDEDSMQESDEITKEIDGLLREMNEINHVNLKKLRKLKEIVKIENNSTTICYIRTEEKPRLKKQEMVLFQKKQLVEGPGQKDILLKYLKHTILKLEQKQLSESIEQVTSTKKNQKSPLFSLILNFFFDVFFDVFFDIFGIFRNFLLLYTDNQAFEVFFEQNLTAKPSYIAEEQLCQLDKLRENSLFHYYNIPQKGLFSFISQNVLKL